MLSISVVINEVDCLTEYWLSTPHFVYSKFHQLRTFMFSHFGLLADGARRHFIFETTGDRHVQLS